MAEDTDAPRDGFIAVRKAELIQVLAEQQALPPEDERDFPQLCRLLGALLHHAAHEDLEALKALYDPLDPDAPLPRRDTTPAGFERFETALVRALERANFTEIDAAAVQTHDATKLLTDLSIKPSFAGIRRIRFFARGARSENITVRTLFGLRSRTVEAEVMNDVVVLVGFKAENEISKRDKQAFAHMRRGVRPGAALVKQFRNVAAPELVTLHPGAKPSMRPRDQMMLAGPALVAGTPILLNLWPALTVLAAIVAAYFTAGQVIDNERLTRAVGAFSGLVALGAFLMRQRLKYEATTLRYHKRLAETVYFRNVANNTGVLDLLIGAGQEQDVKEAFLAYWILRAANAPLARSEIDRRAEALLHEKFQLRTNFEIGDALEKLERFGLVTNDGAAYSAVPSSDGLQRLDKVWDNVFEFAGQSTRPPPSLPLSGGGEGNAASPSP